MELTIVKNRENRIMEDLHTIIEEKNNTMQANVAQLKEKDDLLIQKDDLLKQKDAEIKKLREEFCLKKCNSSFENF